MPRLSGCLGGTVLIASSIECPPYGWVFDMVTDPAVTPLIEAAREQGLKTLGGLDMLVEQAATSFKLFFDADAPRDRDENSGNV